ncbi:hypothetical protein [Baekduia soli]|nr:hypothetical protein [Baekduia soli]
MRRIGRGLLALIILLTAWTRRGEVTGSRRRRIVPRASPTGAPSWW